jgi:nicotinate-nucleotide adenylyltransferase
LEEQGPRERLGVFGGTFDPVHVGHLVAAVNARHALDLDRVLMVVANQPWQKHARTVTPAPDRFAVVEAAVTSVEGIEASAVEVERGGPSYTADTLDELTLRHPGAELFLVIGADVADELDTWERVEAVRERATLVVVNRPGVRPTKPLSSWRAVSLEIPALDISSTDLRARAVDGRPLDFLVPEPAVRLIRQRGLYAGGR